MQVISGVWQFRDNLSSYILTQNTGYTLTNDEYFVSNGNQYASIRFYKAALDNKINEVEYDADLVYNDNSGWDNANYQYIDFGTGVTISDDVYTIITALASQVANLQVVFRNNDNSVITQISTQLVAYGHFATRPSYIPTYVGADASIKEFLDWSSTRETYTQFDFATPIYADTNIYAFYKNKPLVTYYSYGVEVDSDYVATGDTAVPPQDPTPQGTDIFENWSTSEVENIPFDFATPITQDISLYAWFIHVWSVNFWVGNVIVEEQDVIDGNLATKPSDPSSPSEIDFFIGWSVSEEEYLEFDFNNPITNNTDLYAWFEKGNYVYFISENTIFEEQIVAPNSRATQPTNNPTSKNPNKIFRGWSSIENDYIKYNFNEIIDKTTYIYAYFEVLKSETTTKFDYTNYLGQKIEILKKQLNIENNIIIGDERIFENGNYTPDTIFVIIKFLQIDYEFNAKTQPIQISVLTEDNNFEVAKLLFNTFTEKNNWTVINSANEPNFISNSQFIKQQYNSPVVINNFAETDIGFRAILFITANLFIMENILDVNNLKINNVDIKPLTFAMNYSMSGNTQQFPNNYISETVKSAATFAITMSLPMINYNGVTINKHILTQSEISLGSFNVIKSTLPVYFGDLKSVILTRNGESMSFIEYEDYYQIFVLQGSRVDDIVDLNFEYYLVKHILQILKGISSGNDNFELNFEIGDIIFDKNMKLVAFQFNTNPEQIPGFTLNFLE